MNECKWGVSKGKRPAYLAVLAPDMGHRHVSLEADPRIQLPERTGFPLFPICESPPLGRLPKSHGAPWPTGAGAVRGGVAYKAQGDCCGPSNARLAGGRLRGEGRPPDELGLAELPPTPRKHPIDCFDSPHKADTKQARLVPA